MGKNKSTDEIGEPKPKSEQEASKKGLLKKESKRSAKGIDVSDENFIGNFGKVFDRNKDDIDDSDDELGGSKDRLRRTAKKFLTPDKIVKLRKFLPERIWLQLIAFGRFKKLRKLFWFGNWREGEVSLSSEHTMLPLLIKVFAGFAKADGKLLEDEIDSTLGFLRYDYPATVYSELRQLYIGALREPQNLNDIAQSLSQQLSFEEKVLLGIQLYALISRAGMHKKDLITFYLFMTGLGMASQAVDIVYQLTEKEKASQASASFRNKPQFFETVKIGSTKSSEVFLDFIPQGFEFIAYRFHNFILIKNTGRKEIAVRGRIVTKDSFCSFYQGQHITIGDFVILFQDLNYYFNAKKGVTVIRLYIDQKDRGKPQVERKKSRQSKLEVNFGLNISVRALSSEVFINEDKLEKGVNIAVSLTDRIKLGNQLLPSLLELRRQAVELGSNFKISSRRNDVLISNNPQKLRQGDLLLSTHSAHFQDEILLKINFFDDGHTGELEVVSCKSPLIINSLPVRERALLKDGDRIQISDNQSLVCLFSERTILEDRNVINSIQLQDLTHSFIPGLTALDNISFEAKRGEFICVMGPSGCGKSSLLRILAGHLKPNSGHIYLNGAPFYKNLNLFLPYISYSPHEDAFDSLLTVNENMKYAACIRAPDLSQGELVKMVNSRLVELGLDQQKNRLAGDSAEKFLSGGERKRLNIGMEMIASTDILLLDEPTSGLSSKDSERIIDILRGISHNKILIISIHQPSEKIFNSFHKALLLDRNGKMAFFGRPSEMSDYFFEAYQDEFKGQKNISSNIDIDTRTQKSSSPDFIFDVMETPLRDFSANIIFQEDKRGAKIPSRRFTPEFWRDRFQTYKFYKDLHANKSEGKTEYSATLEKQKIKPSLPFKKTYSLNCHLHRFRTMFLRSFMGKFRNKGNLFTTLAEAPALALLVSIVMHYSENGSYDFQNAYHIPTYLFLSLVVAMFLGLTNSADEIIRDSAILQRERNQGAKSYSACYVLSKYLALGIFGVLQCIIYQIIGHEILQIKSMFLPHLKWMVLSNFTGIVIGLIISSLAKRIKTALNFIPIVLIPQIILGGALIKYEQMNKNIDLFNSFKLLIGAEKDSNASKLKVPFICQFMPLRWTYESVIIDQATNNPINKAENLILAEIDKLKYIDEMTHGQKQRFDMLKEAMPFISSMQGYSAKEITTRIEDIVNKTLIGKFNPSDYPALSDEIPYDARQLFINSQVWSLFENAEIERIDKYNSEKNNVFFGKYKYFFDKEIDALKFNTNTIFLMNIILSGILYLFIYKRLTNIKK